MPGAPRPPILPLVLSLLLLGAAAWLWWRAGEPGRRVALEVRTVPTGAEILVDGRARGRSDAVLTGLEEGTVEVRVRRAGYREARRQVRLRRGETPLACFDLEPRTGTLRLRVQGPEEFLLATEEDSWKTPGTLRLDPGEYRFLLRSPGYKDRRVRTRVEPGRETTLAVKMERAPLPAGWPAGAGLPPGVGASRLPPGLDPRALPPGLFPAGTPRLPAGAGGLPPGVRLPSAPPDLRNLPMPTWTPPTTTRRPPPAPAPEVTSVPPPSHPAAEVTPVTPPPTTPQSLMTPVNP